ncbi:hypothetical protein BD413DRAFT_300227 [Trametes elegans]|nr:hypothetical protein BD413DRAFT_300227 [Trametes elegans]
MLGGVVQMFALVLRPHPALTSKRTPRWPPRSDDKHEESAYPGCAMITMADHIFWSLMTCFGSIVDVSAFTGAISG